MEISGSYEIGFRELRDGRVGSEFMSVLVCRTVSLVSRVPSLCCDGRMVEINTSIESAWSTELIFVGIVVNRAIFGELEQVIVCAARSASRFL